MAGSGVDLTGCHRGRRRRVSGVTPAGGKFLPNQKILYASPYVSVGVRTACWAGTLTAQEALQQWRAALLAALTEAEEDTVFVTHFMVINAAVSAAVGDDRMVGFRPDYCSITVLRNEGGRLSLLQRGAEGETRVL